MNILFLSKLSGKKGCGPYYSIPNQVAAQRKVDNVFWYNLNHVVSEDWVKWADVKTLNEYPNERLCDLPKPFNIPDIVIVEEQYEFFRSKIIKEIREKNIPYIIVPRCSLTYEAQHRKFLKKYIANGLYFKSMIKSAGGIHFLTESEKLDSGMKWNKNEFVIPNGIQMQYNEKTFHDKKISMCFIGRIDLHHKGLDLLLKAASNQKSLLKDNMVELNIYGAGTEEQVEELKKEIKSNNLDEIVYYRGPVYGDEKEKVLLYSDVFVLTSRFEGMPMGLLEALSYGVPVLVTRGANMLDVISENQAGWGSETSVEGIEDSLQKMINTKTSFFEKSKRAKYIAGLYSWDQIAVNSHKEYERIVLSMKGEV